MTPSPDDIARELISRGVDPAEIERINPTLGRQAKSGLIAPRLQAPDKIAERGAYIRDYGQINKDRDALGTAYQSTRDLDRFEALNTKETGGIATGGIQHQDYDGWERAAPWNWPGMIGGVVAKQNPKFKEMSGISSGLQGKERPVGSGATSDFEQRLYRMGVPSPEKTGPTNQSIIASRRGAMAEESDRLAFQEEFLRRNGSLSGSQQAWAQYVSANPYTVLTDKGAAAANPRRTDWKTHFGLGPAPAPRQVGSGSAAPRAKKPDGWTKALPKAQRAAALMYKGATAPAGDKSNPYVPTSAAQFTKLPPGSWVLDDDGTPFQKGAR